MFRIIAETYNYLRPVNSYLPLSLLVFAVFAGFMAALVLSYRDKTFVGETVRRLLEAGATSKESALTLAELSLPATRARKSSLKEGRAVRKYVEIANPDECLVPIESKAASSVLGKLFPINKKYACDFEKMKLFIPEEKKYKADAKYEQKTKPSLAALIIFLAVLAAGAVLVAYYLPDIFRMADNFIGSVFKK